MQIPTGEVAAAKDQAAVTALFGSGRSWTAFDYFVNLVVPLLILVVGFGVVKALGSVQPQARPPVDTSPLGILKSMPVAEVMQIHSLQDLNQPLELQVDGIVVPYREMQLAAEVAGRVIEKSPDCRAGHFVQAGQLLIRIDPIDYQQEVERLERMVDQERESINETDQELVNAKLQLEIAAQDIQLAEREGARLRALPAGYASGAELDAALKVLLTATQNRVTIENQISTLGVRRSRTEAAQRLVETQLATAKINLQRCEVRSVADGVIVAENVELNSFIQRGSPIITLEDVSKAEVAIQLRTDQLHWVLDQRVSESTSAAQAIAEPAERSPAEMEALSGLPSASQASDAELAEVVRPFSRQGYSLPETAAVIEYEVSGLTGRTLRWNGRLTRYDGIGLDTNSRTVPVRVEVSRPQELIDEAGNSVQTTSQSALVRGMYVKVKLLIRPQTPLIAIPSLAMRPGNRVWQYARLSEQPNSGADAPAPESVDKSFEASRWTAGAVSVLADLTPVDSIYLAADGTATKARATAASSAAGSSSAAKGQRHWVCDVGSSGLRGGDWVVVSPLSDLGNELGSDLMSVRVIDLGGQP